MRNFIFGNCLLDLGVVFVVMDFVPVRKSPHEDYTFQSCHSALRHSLLTSEVSLLCGEEFFWLRLMTLFSMAFGLVGNLGHC